MVPIYFSAVLQTEDGQLLEVGEACVSETDDAINFTSGFVPLIKLGSTARIARMLGNKELNRFVGKVYLSSSKLLQIVGVDPAAVAEMRRLFSVNELTSTNLIFAPGASTTFAVQKAKNVFGVVRYLSSDCIKIFSMEFIAEEQHLMFSLDTPAIQLDRLMVRVRERVLLKRNAALHICDIIAPTHENALALASFSVRKQQQTQNQ